MKIGAFLARIAGLALVGALLFTACDNLFDDKTEDEAKAEYGWYGNGSSNSFTISNFAQLEEFAKIVGGNTGYGGPEKSDFRGKTVTLTADIDMSGKKWYGIGSSGFASNPFNGTFDGNNKTISGLNMSYAGFFLSIGEDGIVKDMIFVDLNVSDGGGGGLTLGNRGKIQNISIINGNVAGIGAGGMISSNNGIVENCNFSGIVSSSIGGAGGIAETNSTSGVIRNCYVTGSITGNGSDTGGIVRNNSGTIQNCYTIGNVTNSSDVTGDHTGGIAGRNSGTVKDCYTTGNITGYRRVGGVVGSSDTLYNMGTVQNCYATGNVTGYLYVGGIAGYCYTVQNCVALNSSIIATTTSSSFYEDNGRVSGHSNILSNNYGLSTMTLPNFVTVTSNVNGLHGQDVEASVYNSQIWWTTSLNWDFDTVWEWDSTRNLPKLR